MFPSVCVGCGGSIVNSDFQHVCSACSSRMRLIEEPKCLTCGFPFFGETESQSHCVHCEHLDPAFGQGWSIALFRGPLRGLVHSLKYEAGFWALSDLEELARQSPGLGAFLGDAILMPVPLHPRKRRERGYNQSELIAERIVRQYPQTTLQIGLRRGVDTVSQTQFNRRDRIRNLKNAFSMEEKGAIDPNAHYVVVDDVFTTGSTLNACALALRRAGAKYVDVLTIGHG